jgi:DNA binding domain, excisionase family
MEKKISKEYSPAGSSVDNASLLNAQEAAKFLNIKVDTLYDWVQLRRCNIPYIKIGKFLRFRKSDLDKWLEAYTVRGFDDDSNKK